jgi:hypothetical protein
MSDGITTCAVCGAQYLNTALVACAECHSPFGADVLAEGGDEVGYDVADWDARQRADMAGALVRDGIAHRWEDGELVVAEVDAARVEELVDLVDHPDALAELEDDDGGLAADVLSAFYVSSDVLQHDPSVTAAVVELLEAVERAPEAPPYGIDAEVWEEVLTRATAVADLLADDAESDEVAAAARALRELVRPLV